MFLFTFIYTFTQLIQRNFKTRPVPLVNHDIEKPHFNTEKYNPEGEYSKYFAFTNPIASCHFLCLW